MMLHRAARYTLALALLALPAALRAQAFGLNEIGSCALARGFANTSSPCDDASTIYWNPGAMPRRQGLSLYAGAAAIKIDGKFQQDTTGRTYNSEVPTAVVPHVFLNYRNGPAAFGLGVYVPYGLTSQWGDDFPGRFSAKKAALQTIYFQPNLSYQVSDNWSLGGGLVIGYSKVELIQGLDLSATPTRAGGPTFGQLGIAKYTEFGRATLKGSATATGFNLGVHGKLTPELELGVRFLSQVTFSYNRADATFVQLPTGLTLAAGNAFGVPGGTPVDAILAGQFATNGALTPQKVSTAIRNPAQIQFGFGYSGIANTTLSAEYSYVGWRSFNQLPVEFEGRAPSKILREDYNNTSGLRLGAERRMMNGASLRAGFAANTSAAPAETVTPLLPEQDRSLGSLGLGLPVGRYGLDLSYAHIFTPGRRGRLDERAPSSSTAQAIALNSGFYSLNANILSVSLKAAF